MYARGASPKSVLSGASFKLPTDQVQIEEVMAHIQLGSHFASKHPE